MWGRKAPNLSKAPVPRGGGRRPSGNGGRTAFGGGGNRAFRDPTTMAAPDQAFSAAMAGPPGGGAMPVAPAPGGVPGASGPSSATG